MFRVTSSLCHLCEFLLGMGYQLLLMQSHFLSVQIIKVLGEGGFSFVYLAQDEHSGVRFFAIRSLFRLVVNQHYRDNLL